MCFIDTIIVSKDGYLFLCWIFFINRLDQNMQDFVGLRRWSLLAFTCQVISIIQEEHFLIP